METIRRAIEDDWEDAMTLAWKTFLKFEAPDYAERGKQSFQEFITDRTLYKMFVSGVYEMFLFTTDERVIGLITLRDRAHISLLFVDEEFHKRGVGKALIQHLCDYLQKEKTISRVTVNSSPYAKEFYHKLGFVDTGLETVNDGIRYTPMELYF